MVLVSIEEMISIGSWSLTRYLWSASRSLGSEMCSMVGSVLEGGSELGAAGGKRAMSGSCFRSCLKNVPLSFTRSHINRRTQFENPVLEAKRRVQQQQMQSQGLLYRGNHAPFALHPAHLGPVLRPQGPIPAQLRSWRADLPAGFCSYRLP